MLKRELTYENFNGEKVTKTFYFNLSKKELIELEVYYDDGLEKTLNRIINEKDHKALISEFQRIILLAYGERSSDGESFIKSDAIREAFSQTAAYDALFIELATDDKAAAAFITGIMPRDLANAMPVDQDKPTGPSPKPLPAPQTVAPDSVKE